MFKVIIPYHQVTLNMSAITLNNFMNSATTKLWSDIVEEEERNEREKENITKLEHAIADGFVEVGRKEKKRKIDVLQDDWCHDSLKLKEKFCMSVLNKTECKYADKCIHAHSLKELVLTNCAYGKNCNKVKNGKNLDDANICLFVHPNEQGKDNLSKYLGRLGVEVPKFEVKKVPVEVKPVEIKPVKQPVEVKQIQVEVKVPVEVKPIEQPAQENELETKMFMDLTTNVVYVYVHHSKAQETLKNLITSGNTKIQLNVF